MKGLTAMRFRPATPEPVLAPVSRALSFRELAEIAEGQLDGDPAGVVSSVSDLEGATPDDVSYCVSRAKLDVARASAAGLLIVPADTASLDRPVIRVANPSWSFARVLERFVPERPRVLIPISPLAYVARSARIGEDAVIRPFAVVEDGAVIGPRTRIESGAHIGHGARVGADCLIHPHVSLLARCTVGDRVTIHANTVIGSDGYGYATHQGRHRKIPQIGVVVIEDDVEIGANATIDRATLGRTVIGRGTKIDNLVQIGHNCEVGPDCLIVAQAGLSGSTKVGAGVCFAGQTGTVGHVSVGAGSTIAARGVVTKDLPERSFVSGFPARPHAEEKRIQAAMARLPDVLKRLRALEGKLGMRSEGGGE